MASSPVPVSTLFRKQPLGDAFNRSRLLVWEGLFFTREYVPLDYQINRQSRDQL